MVHVKARWIKPGSLTLSRWGGGGSSAWTAKTSFRLEVVSAILPLKGWLNSSPDMMYQARRRKGGPEVCICWCDGSSPKAQDRTLTGGADGRFQGPVHESMDQAWYLGVVQVGGWRVKRLDGQGIEISTMDQTWYLGDIIQMGG